MEAKPENTFVPGQGIFVSMAQLVGYNSKHKFKEKFGLDDSSVHPARVCILVLRAYIEKIYTLECYEFEGYEIAL